MNNDDERDYAEEKYNEEILRTGDGETETPSFSENLIEEYSGELDGVDLIGLLEYLAGEKGYSSVRSFISNEPMMFNDLIEISQSNPERSTYLVHRIIDLQEETNNDEN